MKIFDTHCHLNLPPLSDNWQTYGREARAAGVVNLIIVGADLDNSLLGLEMAKPADNLYCSLGVHPDAVDANPLAEIMTAFEEKIKNDTAQKIVAIGEIGFDFYQMDKTAADFAKIRTLQIQFFTAQLEVAVKYQLPIILHVRDNEVDLDDPNNAYHLIIDTLKKYNLEKNNLIFHCFSGNENYLKAALNFPHSYISFAGNVTYKNARDLQVLAPLVPKNKLLSETDAPFLSPGKYRGTKPCTPAMIVETVNFLQTNFNVDPDDLYENARRCFNVVK
jgi:TatD DNase family protein